MKNIVQPSIFWKNVKQIGGAWLGVALSVLWVSGDVVGPAGVSVVARSQRVGVVAGYEREIILEAVGSGAGGMGFEIRDQPKLGRLTTPIARGDGVSAIVHYRAKGVKKFPAKDFFTFVARDGAGASSFPARVDIVIRKATVLLSLPREVDLGTVVLGEHSRVEVMIKNVGNVDWSGKVVLPAELQMVSVSGKKVQEWDEEIAVGRSVQRLFEFRPERVGTYQAEFFFDKKNGFRTLLRGRTVEPILLDQDRLQLVMEPPRSFRQATLKLANLSTSKKNVRLAGGARLRIEPDEFELDSGTHQTVTIALAPDDVAALDTTLRIQAQGYQATIPTQAQALSAQVSISGLGEGGLDFGVIKEGESGKQSFELSNLGGEPALIWLGVAPPLFCEQSDFVLDPLEKKEIAIVFRSERIGPQRLPVRLLIDGQVKNIVAKAEMIRSEDTDLSDLLPGFLSSKQMRKKKRELTPKEK